MSKLLWIDAEDLSEGDVGFLWHIENLVRGTERYELRQRPPYTNQSHEPRAKGWCGSYNNISTSGAGVWQVMRIAKNGRAKLAEVTDSERLAAWLEEVGYPELISDLIPDGD